MSNWWDQEDAEGVGHEEEEGSWVPGGRGVELQIGQCSSSKGGIPTPSP